MADTCRLGSKARWLWLASVALACVCEAGCVERRMTIRSNPPGAVVYVDDYEIGTTPVSTSFTYYGTRKIRLVKNGYETLTVLQPVSIPWYQVTPIDFFSENIVPGTVRDNRTFDFQLIPQGVVPTEQLLARADGLRRQTVGSGVVQAMTPGAAGPNPPAVSPGGNAPSAAPWPMASPGSPAAPSQPQPSYPTVPPGGWRTPNG
jgi:hypothetical protein